MNDSKMVDTLIVRAREYEAAIRFGDVFMHSRAKSRLEEARAALEASGGVEDAWRPIETAPDDRMFIAAIHHGTGYVVCQARRTKAGVFDVMEDSCVGWRPHPNYKPAFWQPLPAPPAPLSEHQG